MTSKLDIHNAIAELEAGKFSFRMIDAIKAHIETTEGELETLRGMHADAVRDNAQKDYAIFRLEREVAKLNTRLTQAIMANALIEKSLREFETFRANLPGYIAEARTHGDALYRRLTAPETVELVNKYLDNAKKQAAALYAKTTNEETASVARDYIETARKMAVAAYERATMQISALHKSSN